MYNPMTTEYVRMIMPDLSPLRQAFLEAVNDFAYESTWPMESRLGEYAGNKYDRDILVDAVNIAIRKLTVDGGTRVRPDRLQLIKAIADAELHPDTLNAVEKAIEEAAIKVIDQVSEIKGGRQIFKVFNAYHGRQHIAASVSEAIALNYDF